MLQTCFLNDTSIQEQRTVIHILFIIRIGMACRLDGEKCSPPHLPGALKYQIF